MKALIAVITVAMLAGCSAMGTQPAEETQAIEIPPGRTVTITITIEG